MEENAEIISSVFEKSNFHATLMLWDAMCAVATSGNDGSLSILNVNLIASADAWQLRFLENASAKPTNKASGGKAPLTAS